MVKKRVLLNFSQFKISGFQIKPQKKFENFQKKPFNKSSDAFSSLPKTLLNVMPLKVSSGPLIEKPKVISNTLLLSDCIG